jgi:hypothetical protein
MPDNMAKGFDLEESKPDTVSDEEIALKLIESFSIGMKRKGKQISASKKDTSINFLSGNEDIGADAALKYALRTELKYPGINRFQMPEIPSKSVGLRKL